MNSTHDFYKGKVVCVTGAGGSIGSEICRQLARAGVGYIELVGHSEEPLYRIGRELTALMNPPDQAWDMRLGSTANKALMESVVDGCDIVIHAAAHKHVPLCEQNPIEAIENNVGGTITLAEACALKRVPQFVLISSDKAVKPSSVMGATKRACELFMPFIGARAPATKFTTVRFGNVEWSSGSVLPLWKEQIERGGPVTLTDGRCTRYMMSIPDAANLALAAATLSRPEGLFVLEMGKPKNMRELAEWLIAGRKVEIVETGLRPGEKLEEELSYGGDLVKTKIDRVLRVNEDARRVLKWADFTDLLMAARCRAKSMALDQLWSLVK